MSAVNFFSGFDYMVMCHEVDLRDKKVVVLGNGGAAQAKYAVEIFLGTKIDEGRIQEIYETMIR